MTTAVPFKYERRETNDVFRDDTSYQSVSRLLQKLAGKCYLRVAALGIGMTYDDVLQEMNLSYVQARERWDPEGNSRFSTYLTTACYNNFNGRIYRRECERRHLGMVNLSDMRSPDRGDDEAGDLMEIYGAECQEVEVTLVFPDGMGTFGTDAVEQAAPMNVCPEDMLEAKQVAAANLASIRHMTPPARDFMVQLLRAAAAGKDLPTIREFARSRQMGAAATSRMRVEIAGKFGVKC